MQDVVFVQVRDPREQLAEHPAGLGLREGAMLMEALLQVAAAKVLEDEEDVELGLEAAQELGHVVVLQPALDPDLVLDGLELLVAQLVFLDGLDGHVLGGIREDLGLKHGSEPTFPEEPHQPVALGPGSRTWIRHDIALR